jgi:ATP-dependent protease ClpP protease subunit
MTAPTTARPSVPAPNGAQSWYRITNAMEGPDSPGKPCLYIYGDIGSWGITAAQCVDELSEIDAPVIDLYINSPGGEVFDGLAIYNALRSHPAKVMCRVDALAASIASVIAMAGDHVTMSPGSQMMIHDANGAVCGEPAELRKYADFLDAQSDNIAGIYAERAGGTVRQWRARMQAETWYFADEAVAAGLADEVAKPARQDATAEAAAMAASWDLSVYNYAHTSRDDAPPPVLDTACPTHHTATVDSPWDGGAQERRLPSPMTVATARRMYGWYDSAAVQDGKLTKQACKLPHHEVSGDGTPGAANLAACRNALARLPQSDIPQSEHAAIQAHLRAHLADGGSGQDHTHDTPAGAFDPQAFRAAALSSLDPMPGYRPDHMRSLMAGVAHDAPAAPEPARPEAPYVPPPHVPEPTVDPQAVAVDHWRSMFTAVAQDAPATPALARSEAPYVPPPADTVPQAAPQDIAVGYWHSLFAAAALDAPAPSRPAPEPAPEPAPQVVYVPAPPPPAGQVVADYLKAVMTGVANDAPAPPSRPAPEPTPPEPVQSVDRASVHRALWEAEL